MASSKGTIKAASDPALIERVAAVAASMGLNDQWARQNMRVIVARGTSDVDKDIASSWEKASAAYEAAAAKLPPAPSEAVTDELISKAVGNAAKLLGQPIPTMPTGA